MTIEFTHDPDAVRTYAVNWSNNLATGDTISIVTCAVPAGITLESEGPNGVVVTEKGISYAIGTLAQFRLSGGTAGESYEITCHIVTADGDEDDQTVAINCEER